MTDARLPGRWLTDPNLEALSDRLWRVHTGALMWSAEQGTDGLIPRRTLRLLHPDAATLADASMLVDADLWAVDGDGFRVLGWEHSQSLAADIEYQRERNRLKQRAHRARANAERSTRDVSGDVTGYVPGESLRTGESEESLSSEVSISETRDARDAEVVEAEIVESPGSSPGHVEAGVVVDDDAFDRVWAMWPRKQAKKVARLKFAAAAKRHPRGEQGLVADAVDHARAYVQHGHPVQFVLMLSTWLNDDRWEDDLPGPRHERTSLADRNADVLARYV